MAEWASGFTARWCCWEARFCPASEEFGVTHTEKLLSCSLDVFVWTLCCGRLICWEYCFSLSNCALSVVASWKARWRVGESGGVSWASIGLTSSEFLVLTDFDCSTPSKSGTSKSSISHPSVTRQNRPFSSHRQFWVRSSAQRSAHIHSGSHMHGFSGSPGLSSLFIRSSKL